MQEACIAWACILARCSCQCSLDSVELHLELLVVLPEPLLELLHSLSLLLQHLPLCTVHTATFASHHVVFATRIPLASASRSARILASCSSSSRSSFSSAAV